MRPGFRVFAATSGAGRGQTRCHEILLRGRERRRASGDRVPDRCSERGRLDQLVKSLADSPHALVCEDVENVSIDGLDAQCSPDAGATIRLTDVKGAFISGCRPQAGTDTFVKLEGPASEGVVLMANDLSGVSRIAEIAPNVPKTALSQLANYTAEKP